MLVRAARVWRAPASGRWTYPERMTTQDLDRAGDPRLEDDDALGALFASSPAVPVRTSAAAVAGFVVGGVALLSSPFGSLVGLAAATAGVALVVSIIGLARASRPVVAGSVLASLGLVLALATAGVVGVRYAGIDTTVSADVAQAIVDAVRSLSDLVPRP